MISYTLYIMANGIELTGLGEAGSSWTLCMRKQTNRQLNGTVAMEKYMVLLEKTGTLIVTLYQGPFSS